jgi:hypothetical protein
MCFINKVIHDFDDLMHFLNFSLEFLLGMLVIKKYKARLCYRFKELMNVKKFSLKKEQLHDLEQKFQLWRIVLKEI